MISHCMPSPIEPGDRARAWQLLRLATASHGVELYCAQDGPIGMGQWTDVLSLTDRLDVAATDPWSRWRLIRGERIAPRRPRGVARRIRELGELDDYDALILTSPALLRVLRGPLRRFRGAVIIDDNGETDARVKPPSASRGRGPWVVLESADPSVEPQQIRMPAIGWATARVVLPPAVDLDHVVAPDEVAEPAPLVNVAAQDGRSLRWFADELWPEVRRQCPSARWHSWPAPHSAIAPSTLRSGSLVAGLLAPGRRGCWTILLAMAQGCIVATHQAAGRWLPIIHRRDAWLVEDREQWAATLAESLRRPGEPRAMGVAARRWVMSHANLGQCGGLPGLSPQVDAVGPAELPSPRAAAA